MGDLPPCPMCGGVLRLEMRLIVVPGVFAGVTPKLAARDWPHLVCDCGFIEAGKVADE